MIVAAVFGTVWLGMFAATIWLLLRANRKTVDAVGRQVDRAIPQVACVQCRLIREQPHLMWSVGTHQERRS